MHSFSSELQNNCSSVTQRVRPAERAGQRVFSAQFCSRSPAAAPQSAEGGLQQSPAQHASCSTSPSGLSPQNPAEQGRGTGAARGARAWSLPAARCSRGDAAFSTSWHSQRMGDKDEPPVRLTARELENQEPRSGPRHCGKMKEELPGQGRTVLPASHGTGKPRWGHRGRLPGPSARKARGSCSEQYESQGRAGRWERTCCENQGRSGVEHGSDPAQAKTEVFNAETMTGL